MWRGFFPVLGAIALLNGCASRSRPAPPPAYAPYVRVSEPAPGVVQLEIAARRFTPGRGRGPTLWLTGASHLGDAAYYRALQQHLAERTLVLFEGVGGPEAPRGAEWRREHDARGPSGSLQSELARALGLEFQLEAIDYARPNFRHCDLTVDQLRTLLAGGKLERAGARTAAAAGPEALTDPSRSFEELLSVMQGDSFLGRLLNLALRWLGTQPRYQALAKFTLIEMINGVQGDFESVGTLPPSLRELLRVLIDERNRQVVAALHAELPRLRRSDSVAVFYGAGHMRDLEERLRHEFAYVARDEIWFPALTVNTTAAGLSPAEVAATRAMILRQLESLRPAVPGAP